MKNVLYKSMFVLLLYSAVTSFGMEPFRRSASDALGQQENTKRQKPDGFEILSPKYIVTIDPIVSQGATAASSSVQPNNHVFTTTDASASSASLLKEIAFSIESAAAIKSAAVILKNLSLDRKSEEETSCQTAAAILENLLLDRKSKEETSCHTIAVASINPAAHDNVAQNSVHAGCAHEECKLRHYSVDQILKFGGEVRESLLACPDLGQHTIVGIPIAPYILSNCLGSGPILKEIEKKYGTAIFNYADAKGNSTLHWAMTSNKQIDIMYTLLKEMDPNVVNAEGKTPLQVALKRLADNNLKDNPDLYPQGEAVIRKKIDCLLGNKRLNKINLIESSNEIIQHMPMAKKNVLLKMLNKSIVDQHVSDASDDDMADLPPLVHVLYLPGKGIIGQ